MKKILAGVLVILSAVFLFASISVSAKTEIADNGKVYFAKGNAVYEMGENSSAKQIVFADKQILKIEKALDSIYYIQEDGLFKADLNTLLVLKISEDLKSGEYKDFYDCGNIIAVLTGNVDGSRLWSIDKNSGTTAVLCNFDNECYERILGADNENIYIADFYQTVGKCSFKNNKISKVKSECEVDFLNTCFENGKVYILKKMQIEIYDKDLNLLKSIPLKIKTDEKIFDEYISYIGGEMAADEEFLYFSGMKADLSSGVVAAITDKNIEVGDFKDRLKMAFDGDKIYLFDIGYNFYYSANKKTGEFSEKKINCISAIDNILKPVKSSGKMSRAKAVTAVMKIVGVKNETAVKNNGNDFSDVLPNDEEYKYISAAKDVIALGEGETRRFNPDREITLREFLTFVLRAMKGKDNVSYDNIENECIAAKLAQKYEFNDHMLESPLEKAEFDTVILRLLAAKRYLYCENGEIKTDNDGKILYREWVLSNNNETK